MKKKSLTVRNSKTEKWQFEEVTHSQKLEVSRSHATEDRKLKLEEEEDWKYGAIRSLLQIGNRIPENRQFEEKISSAQLEVRKLTV